VFPSTGGGTGTQSSKRRALIAAQLVFAYGFDMLDGGSVPAQHLFERIADGRVDVRGPGNIPRHR
jgi:hypothetical protein